MELERTICYRALATRDARFDGRFFTAVRTTGVYCRPVCPARTPRLENVAFFVSAAAAQAAGFRPCLRCRPESSPQLAAWRGTGSTVTRALALIADGALDEGEAGLERLADRLGIGGRQLRRLFHRHLGTTPIAVAQTRRVLFAKQLLHETDLKMSEVALAAGFGSVRQFNAIFLRMFGRAPSALRPHAAEAPASDGGVTLLLSHAAPYDWRGVIEFLSGRAIAGVEVVTATRYQRTIELDGCMGTIEVSPVAGRAALRAVIRFAEVRALPAIVARIRRVFDLAADVQGIEAHLREDPSLAPLVRARPGLRVPGAWDGFETGVRAILGQQVTVVAARALASRLVAAHGASLPAALAAPGLTHVFPPARRLARADLSMLGMPAARRAALKALAATALRDPQLFERDDEGVPGSAIARLRTLPGIGEWTAQYIALRVLRDPDAFPASDLGLLRAAGTGGTRPTPAALLARAEAWRPWRAYAAQHLWTADAPSTTVEKERER